LARYLRAQLIVLLCGGILGPIWIAAYFALPSLIGSQFGSYASWVSDMTQQGTQWMLWAGLLITLADVLIAVWLANRGARSSARTSALYETGVLTIAQITGLRETGMRINDRPVAVVNLRITGPGFGFDTEKRVTVDLTKQAVITARKLVVIVDPSTRQYEIDWQASGLINGIVPAQFTSTEDNRTYDLSGQAGPLMEILQIYKANKLPFGGTVDLRAYPAVRQQIMAVVRRAAAQQQPAPAGAGAPVAPPPVAAPPRPPVGQRLQELETLRVSGALTDQEYNARRAQIISEI
jgi:hypothetical protein